MSEQQQASQPWMLILIIVGIFMFRQSGGGGSDPKPGPVDPVQPDPVVVEPAESDYWASLAHCVETKAIGGELQQNTDHLLKIVDLLKEAGRVSDTSRVEAWRAKRVEITDSNRAQIVASLRGDE